MGFAVQATTSFKSATVPRSSALARLTPTAARAVLLAVTLLSATAGLLVTDAAASAEAVARAGPELANLLRAMAALKVLFGGSLVAVTLWRLGAPVTWLRLVAYALACAAMGVGPGLIWSMAHVVAGAVLLHGGLLAGVLLLWRDPATSSRLAASIAARRSRLAG